MPVVKNKSQNNKISSLFDIWSFCDLINYRGGRESFGFVHRQLAGFITAPQCAKPKSKGEGRRTRYNRRRMVLMSRGHLKSTIGSVLYVLWRIYRNPNIRVLYGTNTLPLAESFIRELRQYLEDPVLCELVWNNRPHIKGRLIPVLDGMGKRSRYKTTLTEDGVDVSSDAADKKVKWTNYAIQVMRSDVLREPTVLSTSTKTKVTGQHYDLLILDDIVDFENVTNQKAIDKTFDWVQDMESVVDPARDVFCGQAGAVVLRELVGDEVLISGTRYAKGDYYEYVETNAKDIAYNVFKRNIYRNGKNDEAGYTWQEKFTHEYVSLLRKRMSARRWASQYLNKIADDENKLLNRDLINWVAINQIQINKDGTVDIVNNTVLKERGIYKLELKLYITIDPAVTVSDTSDNTCVIVGGRDKDNCVYVIEVVYGKILPNKVPELVEGLCHKYGVFMVHIENNGVGALYPTMMRNQFKGNRPISVKEHRTGVGNVYKISGDKRSRIENGIQPLLENKSLYMNMNISHNGKLLEEFDTFPTGSDDFLDNLNQLQAISRPGSFGKTHQVTRPLINKKYGGTR